jgi:hypothetical protein
MKSGDETMLLPVPAWRDPRDCRDPARHRDPVGVQRV